jgi:hypothetical protein
MPPHAQQSPETQLGWKAFFTLLALMQVIGLGVVWRTYDAVSETSVITKMHDYQIKEEIRPDIQRLKQSIYPYGKSDAVKTKPQV